MERTKLTKPYRGTRPDWGNRIGWAVIVASIFYFAVRIVPALIINAYPRHLEPAGKANAPQANKQASLAVNLITE